MGLFASGALTATGVTSANLPPLVSPTSEPTTTPTPTPEPTTQAPKNEGPKPSLKRVPGDRAAPGERFPIAGTLPSSKPGAVLQVQVKDGDDPWDDFPIKADAGEGGKFETKIYTSRTGERKFRVIDTASGDATPEITVTIG